MAIQCQKCSYIMVQSEAMGYMSAEACNIFKNVILPCLIAICLKRDFKQSVSETSEPFILGFLNYYEIKCHVCHEYIGWSSKIDLIVEQKNNQELEL